MPKSRMVNRAERVMELQEVAVVMGLHREEVWRTERRAIRKLWRMKLPSRTKEEIHVR